MRKTTLNPLLAALAAMLIIACQGKTLKTENEERSEDRNGLSEILEEDRKAVNDSVEKFIGYLRNQMTSNAIDMLWTLEHDSIRKIDSKQAAKQEKTYKSLHGTDYHIESIQLKDDTENLAKFKIVLFEKEPDDQTPNAITMGLKPVRVGAKWYLTIADVFMDHHTH